MKFRLILGVIAVVLSASRLRADDLTVATVNSPGWVQTAHNAFVLPADLIGMSSPTMFSTSFLTRRVITARKSTSSTAWPEFCSWYFGKSCGVARDRDGIIESDRRVVNAAYHTRPTTAQPKSA
jgi:hypothetical protein